MITQARTAVPAHGSAAETPNRREINGQNQNADRDHPEPQHRQDREQTANQECDAEQDAQRTPCGQRDFVFAEAKRVTGDGISFRVTGCLARET